MRLTLRTLLAYRDRVLRPAEMDDMHARVQQSVLASNLIKRIDAVSQRTNLLAPPIEGKGLGADANSIAEYLDDTLGGEKVPELERICLESDVQLAELAQCHQLLSDGLLASVEIPKELRQRIVAFADPAARQLAIEQRTERQSADLEAPPKPHASLDARRVEAEETVRAERLERSVTSSRFRTDPAHSPVGGNGQDSSASTVTASQVSQAVSSPRVVSGGGSIGTRGLDLEGAHLANEVPEYLRGRTRDGWLGPLAIGGLVAVLCLLVWLSIGSWNSVREMLASQPNNAVAKNAEENKTGQPASKDASANNDSAAASAGPSAPARDSGPAQNDATASADPDANDVAAIPGLSLPKAAAAQEDRTGTSGSSSTGQSPVKPGEQAMLWLPIEPDAQQAVILVQAGRQLHRLIPADPIGYGQPVFVPPAFRPTLTMPSGLNWTVAGMTHLVAAAPLSSDALPQLELHLAQAVLTSTKPGEGVELRTAAGQVRLKLNEAASQVAVALDYPAIAFGPATDRTVHPATLFAMVLSGSATIDVGNSPVSLAVGQAITLSGSQIAQSQPVAPPAWVDAANDRPVDLLAARDLAAQLTEDASIGDKLIELASNRRPEMRALAAQTLGLLGSWNWVADPKGCLNNPRDRSFWSLVLERTRQLLAAHPENAQALQASLEQLDSSTAAWRLQMWLGVPKPPAGSDSLTRLTESLQSDALVERVLALDQLQRLTGKELGFQAEEGGRAAAQNLARELSAGRIPLLDAPRASQP